MLRSETSSRTTYPQGFIATGLAVSIDRGMSRPRCRASSRPAPYTVGLDSDGVPAVLGSVASDQEPKCRSSAMKMPLIVVPWPKSLQSPRPR